MRWHLVPECIRPMPAVVLTALALLTACNIDEPLPEPSQLVVTGADQTGIVGQALANPITVELRRPGGHLAPSWPLTIRGVSGNLSIRLGATVLQGDGATITITAQNSVQLEITLGPLPGIQSFEVFAPGIDTAPTVATVSLTAVAASNAPMQGDNVSS